VLRGIVIATNAYIRNLEVIANKKKSNDGLQALRKNEQANFKIFTWKEITT
jgi:hypothetical protein